MHRLRLLLTLTAALLLAGAETRLAEPPAAEAAFPGQNGLIAFERGQDLFVVMPDGGNESQLTDDPVADDEPVWSPDSKKIAFASEHNGARGIFMINATGSGLTQITHPNSDQDDPRSSWAPNGTQIVFERDNDGDEQIWLGGISGVEKILPGSESLDENEDPAWSPDGSTIVFVGNCAVECNLYKAPSTGGDASSYIAITQGGGYRTPTWSPDGTKLAFSLNGTGTPQVGIMNADGSGEMLLTTGADPAWSPDGTKLVYAEGGHMKIIGVTAGATPTDTGVMGANPDWGSALPVVDGVEFTQAIQELQSLGVLQNDLKPDGKPPVPIIEGKPAAMRIYFAEVDQTTVYEVEATGDVNGSRFVSLTPGCTPEQRRTGENNCKSVDFMFTPPPGDWSTTLKIRLQQDSQVLEEHEFNLTSVETDPLVLKPVTVCDHLLNAQTGVWNCGSLFDFVDLLPYLRATFPGEVIVAGASSTIYVDTDEVTDPAEWWQLVGDNVRALWTADGAFDNLHHYGVVRPQADAGTIGGVAYTLANAVAGKTSLLRDDIDGGLPEETAHELVAHLIADNLGLGHAPSAGGCYGTPAEVDPGWPSGGSPETGEVGYDVADEEPIPDDYADWTSFCAPRWISPYTANNAIDAFRTGGVTAAQTAGLTPGDFWLVSGLLDEDAGTAEFDSLFELETEGSAEAGTGLYRVEVRDSGGGALFTRFFAIDNSQFEDEGSQASQDAGIVRFAELIPVQANAAKIVVISGNNEVGELELGGVTPVVQLTPGISRSVAGAPPLPKFSWNVEDSDSASHSFWLELSHDGGQTWDTIAPRFSGDTFAVDPAFVGGGEGLLLRVRASDGVNTGVAVTEPFNLQEQAPQGAISAPASGATFATGDLVWLQAAIVDPEDGVLDGGSVTWSSSRDGSLGTGTSLQIYDLSVGTHTISLFAKDSDNNELADSITITVSSSSLSEGGEQRTWGDNNCSGNADPVDALLALRFDAGLPTNTGACPVMGSVVEVLGASSYPWGDIDCSGDVGPIDGLKLLRFDSGLSVAQEPGCPLVGGGVVVAAGAAVVPQGGARRW